MITGPCCLCYYCRPLYDPQEKRTILELNGQAVLTCTFNVGDSLPVIKPNWDVAVLFGWWCFTPMPERKSLPLV